MADAELGLMAVGELATRAADRLGSDSYPVMKGLPQLSAWGQSPAQLRRGLLSRREEIVHGLSEFRRVVLLADLSSTLGASLTPSLVGLLEGRLRGAWVVLPGPREGMRTFLAGTALGRLLAQGAPILVTERANLMDGFWSSPAEVALEHLTARMAHIVKEVALPYLMAQQRGTFLMVVGSSQEPEEALAKLALKAQGSASSGAEGIVLAPGDKSLAALEALVQEAQAVLRVSLSYKLAKLEETIAVLVCPLEAQAVLRTYDPLSGLKQLDDEPSVALPEAAELGLPYVP